MKTAVAIVIGFLVLIATIVLLMPSMPLGPNAGMILGPMRVPAMNIPEWLSGGLDHLIGFLFSCMTDGCVVTNQPVGGGGGGGGGWPACQTCNTPGPPGTTPGGGGGWVRKLNPWSWAVFSSEKD